MSAADLIADPHLIFTGPSPDGIHKEENGALCLRKAGFALENVQGDSNSPALARGTLVHTGLAHHYALRMQKQRKQVPTFYDPEHAMRIVAEHMGPVALGVVDHCVLFVQWYQKKMSMRDASFEIVAPELLVEAALPGWASLGLPPKTARVDLIYKKGNVVYFMDHKTAGYAKGNGKEHAWIYARTAQFLLLHWIGLQVPSLMPGATFGGVVLNLCQVGNDPDTFQVLRPTLDPVGGRLASLPSSLMWFRTMRLWWEKSGVPARFWPANYSEHACRGRYSRCDYANICDHSSPDGVEAHPKMIDLLRHVLAFVD